MAETAVVPKASVVGSPEQIAAAVVVAREYAAHVDHDARPLARSYRRLRDGEAHLTWLKGKDKSWERFCQEALGYEAAFLDEIEDGVRVLEGEGYDDRIPAQRAIAVAESLGEAPKSGDIGNSRRVNHTPTTGRGSGGAAYNARRLKRDAPDVYEAYKAGQYPSAYAAAVAAGIAKPRLTIERSVGGFVRAARKHFPEHIAELVRLLQGAG